ncbi:unnamed protein product [Adineta ricciae]|uniref:N-acetylgalactosaminide beta-1,3-galactosyltransferase n=1 Tax=Adineta ricciae TaxID=249248 RepID=A0A813PFM6_ADIRI|nr:unnamed protein product [Adineta ricciae]
MRLRRYRHLLIYLIFAYILFFVICFREKLQLTTTRSPSVTTSDTPTSKAQIIRSELIFNASTRYQLDLSNCWTDLDYQQWKDGKYFPASKPKGNIVYMVQTGEKNLRTRCDIMMCTFGVTLHPSRLFFVGETPSDSRLPVYDVVEPNTPRPVDRKGSMQKVAQGLDMIVNKLREGDYNNEIEWIMVMDDDTFISPPNLNLLAAEYDSQRPVMIGQHTCKVGFCGGGGYLISRALFVQLPAFVKKCRPHDELWDSDQFVPDCIRRKVQVELIDRKEFNSQNPEFYSTPLGLQDHPNGFGRAVTFHYMKTPMKYVNLWRLHQAYMRE